MLGIMEKDTVIRLYLQGYSKSEISRLTNRSRTTVRKYISEYDEIRERIDDVESETEKEKLIILSSTKPKYDVSNRQRYKVTPEMATRLKELIEHNDNLKRSNKRKLMMKKKDMHRVLVKEGFDISYRTVCDLVNEMRPKSKEAYIRQEVEPGDAAEFDWGDVTLTIDEIGKERRFKLAIFTLKNSDMRWAHLYMNENTECFLDAHARFIDDIEGVTKEIVYDNAKVQVKKFVGKTEKLPTDALKMLTNYYGYNHRFTNAYSGNEKGHVERSVEVVRRRAYSLKQHFKTYEEAVTSLKMAVDELNNETKQRTAKSAVAAFAHEKKFLQPNRIKLDVGVIRTSKVDKYGFIYVDSNYYSVPDYLVGKELTIKKYPMHIRVFYNNKEITILNRIYGKNEYRLNIMHYIDTLKKKPGAIRNSLALRQSATWLQEIFHKYFITNPKEFVVFLELNKEFNINSIKSVIQYLERHQIGVTLSMIKYYLLNDNIEAPEEQPKSHIDEFCINQVNEINALFQTEPVQEGALC